MKLLVSIWFAGILFIFTLFSTGCVNLFKPSVTAHAPVPPRQSHYAVLPHHLGLEESYLLTRLEKHDVTISHENNLVRLLMPTNTNFAPNSAVLNNLMMDRLDTVASLMKQYPYTIAEIQGHTDSRGTIEHNQHLSEQRALGVIMYLVAEGIPEDRLTVVGHSELKPRANNKSVAGRLTNRRAEITLHEARGRHDSYNFDPFV